MAGRRRVDTGVGQIFADEGKARRDSGRTESQSARDFDRKLQAAGIEAGLASGAIQPLFQGGNFQGFEQGQPQPQPQPQQQGQDLDSLLQQPGTKISQVIQTPQGKMTITREAAKEIAPRQQIRQQLVEAQQSTPASFQPQAQSQLLQNLPQQAFAPGPQGGVVGGRLPQGELPQASGLLSRGQAVQQLAPGLAGTLRQNRIQDLTGLGEQIGAFGRGQSLTIEFRESIQAGLDAIQRGAGPFEVKQRLKEDFPDKAAQIDSIFENLLGF